VKAFVTGGGGFIGRELVRQLRARGDDVVAVVRQAGHADSLNELGCTVVEGDLAIMPITALEAAMRGCDAVFHVAGWFWIGIRATQHAAMYATNLVSTQRVLDAAVAAAVPRIVYVSTGNVYGDTHGQIVDETFRRPQPPRYLSYYDETKYLAHLAAEERIAAGAPILIALPGGVYGPGDQSQVGTTFIQAMAGTLPAVSFPDLGLNPVLVGDVATGILLIHDRGRIGEQYNLGGELMRTREAVRRAAAVAGRKPPRLTVPTRLLSAISPLGGIIGPLLGVAPNMRELIRAAGRVTYWTSDAKARTELGYAPHDFEWGLRTVLEHMTGNG